jgi:Domain of unknown function (DUF1905)
MERAVFTGVLERDNDGTWWYIHVPQHIRDAFKHVEKRGTIPVTATIGHTTWNVSLLPWADGSAQLTINKTVRSKEALTLGQELQVIITPRTS